MDQTLSKMKREAECSHQTMDAEDGAEQRDVGQEAQLVVRHRRRGSNGEVADPVR